MDLMVTIMKKYIGFFIFILLTSVILAAGCSSSDSSDAQNVKTSEKASSGTTEQEMQVTKEPTEISTPIIEETQKSEEKTTKLEDAKAEDSTEKDSTEKEYQETLAKQEAEEASSSEEPEKEIVSTSFSDFTPYTDTSATTLQKEAFFDEHFKDKYVTWSGKVASVDESFGSYTVQVKHSSQSLISDAIITMRDDQKDKLLQLKEGSPITYTAKLTRYGEILGISGEDGTIE